MSEKTVRLEDFFASNANFNHSINANLFFSKAIFYNSLVDRLKNPCFSYAGSILSIG
jgi:hypothetical protein